MLKFIAGTLFGAGLILGADYFLVYYSWLPEIFIINNSEARSHPLPFLEKQFYAAMEAQRQAFYARHPEPR